MEHDNQNPETPPQTARHPEPNFAPPYRRESEPTEKGTPIEGPLNLSNILGALLKRPLDLVATIEKNHAVPWLPLALIALACLALFGLVVGAFSAGNQLWAAPLKITGGALFAGIICLPSLLIFSSLAGVQARFQTLAALLLAAISITALLLVGFAPVVWLFSTSSDSAIFFGFLCLVLWLVCLTFGLRFIGRTARALGAKHTAHLGVWCAVFILVTLQLPTTLRPIIDSSPNEPILTLDEKKFFLKHWSDQFSRETANRNELSKSKQNPIRDE